MNGTKTHPSPISFGAEAKSATGRHQGKLETIGPHKESRRRYEYLLEQTELFKHFIQFKQHRKLAPTVTTDRLHNEGLQDKRHAHVEEEALDEEEATSVRFSETPPYICHGTMRDYQIQGLNWLISLYENDINGILADEMGLGKTLQSLSFLGYLKHYRNVRGPHLIIAPKSTLGNWYQELQRWTPDLKAFVFHGTKEQRSELIKTRIKPGDFEVMISSYEICLIEQGPLKRVSWEYIIIDEAHRIKNEHSMLSQAVRLFPSTHRLLLTGTPLQNNLHELWALLNFLLPDVFSDAEEFESWFKSTGADTNSMVTQLRKLLSPFLLRRLKSDVEKSLLPKKEIYLYVELAEPLQHLWYQKILERDIDALNGHTTGSGKERKTRLMNIVMQLRKCANHPYLFHGAEPGPPYTTDAHLVQASGKMIVLDKLLDRLKKAGSRVLLFSQMSRMLDILEDYCTWRGYELCRIDGSSTAEERLVAMDDFNHPNSTKFIFLLTTRAGGLGINLSTADVVILYDSDWNPQVDLQAQDRAHRIGQLKQVKIFRLITENTIEEQILERSMQKLRLDQLVIQQGRLTSNQTFTQDDLLNMIRHGAKEILRKSLASNSPSQDIVIDDLIRKSEERTHQLQEKYKNAGLQDLEKFSLSSIKPYEWMGEDYSARSKEDDQQPFFIKRQKRERRSAFENDPYYVPMMTKSVENKPPMLPKQAKLYEWQFFPQQLHFLLEKELLYYRKLVQYKVPVLPNESPTKRLEEQAKIDQALPLTKEEEATKEHLFCLGFGDWTKKEYHCFLRACEKYGRKNFIKIAQEIETKSVEQVRHYSSVFWTHCLSLRDGEKTLAAVERGEDKIRRVMELQYVLDAFIKYYHPDCGYTFPKSKLYTPQEDYFMIRHLQMIGLGNEVAYDYLREIVRSSKLFQFDWFLRSRSSTDLAKRCSVLLLSIQKWTIPYNLTSPRPEDYPSQV